MQRRATEFQTIRSEGGLLPRDLLRRVLDPKEDVPGTRPEEYGLPENERINETITQSWNRLQRHWKEFRAGAQRLPEEDAGTGLTNDKWSLPLMRELGFGMLPTSPGPEIDGRTYAISRFAGPAPIHLIGCGLSLDRRAAGQRGAAAVNPHGLVQEFLNRSDLHLWAIVSNGLQIRILRDSQALSRQSYLEFNLESMFEGETFSDFVLLWLTAHATRFAIQDGDRPESCWLEQWTMLAAEQGTRALGDLRQGVEKTIEILGQGFVGHPRNAALRESLRTGELSLSELHGQLLRVVYRLIFLFVAEDRNLDGLSILHPRNDTDVARKARDRFASHYSTTRLRELASKIRGSRHGDLWQQFNLLVGALCGDEQFSASREQLALPVLGSFLWDPSSTSALNSASLTNGSGSELANADFLEALRHLAFVRQDRLLRSVDFKNLGSEELGGVYEGLLALTPQISADGARFTFAEFAGSERKTSGSYYTPDSLVQCLLDSALDPVIRDAIQNKSSAEAETAILSLKVCDPAVGSGHFLVGAAHRLARQLARVRALDHGESEPSPSIYQQALRDVIGRCLYGVDISPMSAELCRVSLWLEAIEPGKPLSFLDHHIRVGNSLLGTTPELIADGLPDMAFKPIEGDDKKACAVLKKRNKAERKGLGPLFAEQDAETQASLEQAAATLEELPDDRPADIRAKELAFRHHEETEEYRQKKQLADAWCAAFVIKKQFGEPGRETSANGITQRHLNDLADSKLLPAELFSEVEPLSDRYQFFHWHLAFPEVFARGGFDCVLGNPPWERVKLQEKEWFAERHPEIANAPNAAARKRMIAALKGNDPELYQRFLNDSREAEGQNHLLRNSGHYPLCGRGDINLYTVFAECMRTLVNETGRAGAVLPTGIATDDTTKFFFQDVVSTKSLASLFDFENKSIFPDVHSSYKFCLFTAGSGVRPTAEAAEFVFFAHSVEELRKPERRFRLSPEEIRLLNPNTHTCPIFTSKNDVAISLAIYRRHDVILRENAEGATSHGIRVTRMFDMNKQRDLFATKDELIEDGLQFEGGYFQGKDSRFVRLFEGKTFTSFDHRFAVPGVRAEGGIRTGTATDASEEQHKDSNFLLNTILCLDEGRLDEWSQGRLSRNYLLSFMNVTSAMNHRTAICAILPDASTDYSVRIVVQTDNNAVHAAILCGLFNSFPFDYTVRQKLQGLNLSDYITYQLAVPSKEVILELSMFIVPRVLELSYTAWDLAPFACDCGWDGPPFRWDEERRFISRCELDAAYFHLYFPSDEHGNWRTTSKADGRHFDETTEELKDLKRHVATPRDAVNYIMDTFPIVRRKEEEKGEYRTKRVILEIYDAMQEAILSGESYQTGLDPPPGPPVDVQGKFISYEAIVSNPPPHIHLPRGAVEGANLTLQLSDLAGRFPNSPFVLRLGSTNDAPEVYVRPVLTTEIQPSAEVVLASQNLQRQGTSIPAAVGRLRIEARTNANDGSAYVLVSVRGNDGLAQARFGEDEWRALTSIGMIEDLADTEAADG